MNIEPQPEPSRETPEADAFEQQLPVLPEGSEERLPGPLPADASEADAIEQRTDVLPGSAGPAPAALDAGLEAAEADLIEQAQAPPLDNEEDYPDARQEPY
jgi:hypothetical protein